MNRLARAFLQAAEEDLASARRLLPDLRRPAVFHLQQAAEKLAKAILAGAGVVPVPRSHDIGYLAGLIPAADLRGRSLAALADLSAYSLAGRYPEGDDLGAAPDEGALERWIERIERLLKEVAAA